MYEIGLDGKVYMVGQTLVAGDDVEIGADEDDVAEVEKLLASAGGSPYGMVPKARVRSKGPSDGRYVDMPFPATTIAAGATVDIVQRPQRVFRPNRLVIDPTSGIRIAGIFIGERAQLTNITGEIPAAIFAFNALTSLRHWDTAQISHDVVVRTRNATGAPVEVSIGMSGPVVR